MEEFSRIKRLPPYVFATVTKLMIKARAAGEDIIDLGMGNPDNGTPQHIVDKLVEASYNPKNHRYSASRGITKLRLAISSWYKRRYDVDINHETEAIVTIGSKEGLAHLALATINAGDVVLAPDPTYPIHKYCVIIAGGEVVSIPLDKDSDFFEDMVAAYKRTSPKPKMLIISFPHNPTTATVELDFFQKVADFANENNLIVVHDLAYADTVFDGYKCPSFLQAKGAKNIGVELFTLSKSYNMPGWRVGFCVGNEKIVGALQSIKSYLDYGIFQPIQIASIIALNGPQECVDEITALYQKRRDVLIKGLNDIGWEVESPKATMFVWAKIPEKFRAMGSLEFSKLLLTEGKVAVSPGVGFGACGNDYVRFALVENEKRIRQAVKGIKFALESKK